MKNREPDSIESPCVQVCELDADDICMGCGRSLEEIGNWLTATPVEKMQILVRANQRRSRNNRAG